MYSLNFCYEKKLVDPLAAAKWDAWWAKHRQDWAQDKTNDEEEERCQAWAQYELDDEENMYERLTCAGWCGVNVMDVFMNHQHGNSPLVDWGVVMEIMENYY